MPPATETLPLNFPQTDQLKEEIRYLQSVKNEVQTQNGQLREILKATEEMRKFQRRYFHSRSRSVLKQAIAAEKKLDQLISNLHSPEKK